VNNFLLFLLIIYGTVGLVPGTCTWNNDYKWIQPILCVIGSESESWVWKSGWGNEGKITGYLL